MTPSLSFKVLSLQTFGVNDLILFYRNCEKTRVTAILRTNRINLIFGFSETLKTKFKQRNNTGWNQTTIELIQKCKPCDKFTQFFFYHKRPRKINLLNKLSSARINVFFVKIPRYKYLRKHEFNLS